MKKSLNKIERKAKLLQNKNNSLKNLFEQYSKIKKVNP